jgi:hypothetical protein
MIEFGNVSAFLQEMYSHIESLDNLVERLTSANDHAVGGEPKPAENASTGGQPRSALLTSRMGEVSETVNRLLIRLSHEVDRVDQFTGEAPPMAAATNRLR